MTRWHWFALAAFVSAWHWSAHQPPIWRDLAYVAGILSLFGEAGLVLRYASHLEKMISRLARTIFIKNGISFHETLAVGLWIITNLGLYFIIVCGMKYFVFRDDEGQLLFHAAISAVAYSISISRLASYAIDLYRIKRFDRNRR
jgi:hypothetical protein